MKRDFKIWLLSATAVFFLFIVSGNSFGQNLIENGDFEEFYNCPSTKNFPANDSNHLKQWYSFNSIDYFNKCGDSSYGVPINIFGKTEAASGSGYVGIAMIVIDTGYHEQLYIPLNKPLIKDSTYIISAQIQITEYSLNLNYFEFYFTKNKPTKYSNYYASNIDSNSYKVTVPYSKSGKRREWKKIQVEYVANGNEQYFLIGMLNNKKLDSNKLSSVLCSGNKTTDKFTRRVVDFNHVYYYLDDIKIEKRITTKPKTN